MDQTAATGPCGVFTVPVQVPTNAESNPKAAGQPVVTMAAKPMPIEMLFETPKIGALSSGALTNCEIALNLYIELSLNTA